MFVFLYVNVIYVFYIYVCIYNLKLLVVFIVVIELCIKFLKNVIVLLYNKKK